MSHFPSALLTGYRNFMGGRYLDQRDRYRALAEQGQQPHTLVVACCDSRAAPEMIFDSVPGELFVVRNVANMVPPYEPDGQYHSTSAALEFAVQALRVRDIIVMGHGRCGGIKAALDPNSEPLSPGDFIGKWMNLVAPAAEQIQGNSQMTSGERQTALERILEERGKLRIHGAWFDISNGELWLMDPQTQDFTRIEPEEMLPAQVADEN
jgi:carbonic anhydrase